MSDSQVPDWIKKHLQEYAANPRKAYLWDATSSGGRPDTPTLLLTTTGRKSGKRLTLPLIYGDDGSGRYIIVASKGGAPENPAWYLNLQADPQVDVQVAEKKFRATARTANSNERPGMWKVMTGVYPRYPDYQARTDREIPVVVLEPLS